MTASKLIRSLQIRFGLVSLIIIFASAGGRGIFEGWRVTVLNLGVCGGLLFAQEYWGDRELFE